MPITTELDAEISWEIQRLQAVCAKKLGFIAAKSVDEQGVVYMIDMFGKDEMLKLV